MEQKVSCYMIQMQNMFDCIEIENSNQGFHANVLYRTQSLIREKFECHSQRYYLIIIILWHLSGMDSTVTSTWRIARGLSCGSMTFHDTQTHTHTFRNAIRWVYRRGYCSFRTRQSQIVGIPVRFVFIYSLCSDHLFDDFIWYVILVVKHTKWFWSTWSGRSPIT